MTESSPKVSVVIPTYNREQVLVDTLNQLLNLSMAPHEIIVADQTPEHEPEVQHALQEFSQNGDITWLKLPDPSIPHAMNAGLQEATGEVVLYIDDDVELTAELIHHHAEQYGNGSCRAVAGQVIQSWQLPLDPEQGSYAQNNETDPDAFMFNSSVTRQVKRFAGGNTSFLREALLDVGGFDENFVRVAYRFEAETADRFVAAGNTIIYCPKATLRHLKEATGGTRTWGEHFRTLSPGHAVGRYYYFLVVANQDRRWKKMVTAPFTSTLTRFHLSHPWWIPLTFAAEIAGLFWALTLFVRGQKLIDQCKHDWIVVDKPAG